MDTFDRLILLKDNRLLTHVAIFYSVIPNHRPTSVISILGIR